MFDFCHLGGLHEACCRGRGLGVGEGKSPSPSQNCNMIRNSYPEIIF